METVEKKKLRDLCLVDLKTELEKRSLDITGSKTALFERLKKALQDEGEDPNTFYFDVQKTVGDNEEDQLLCDDSGTTTENGNLFDEQSAADTDQGQTPTGGDESFVVQEDDDTVLNDIDADLLDGEGKSSDSTRLGQAEDNKGSTNKARQSNSSTVDASDNTLENTDTKDSSKTAGRKDEKDLTAAKSSNPEDKGDKGVPTSRNLWVSGLSSRTRATDLKALFSKHGKVIAAKVVTNAKAPTSRCFGLVTLATPDDATNSIERLHRTELHGRMISVERAKTETQGTKSKILPPSDLKSPSKPRAQPTVRKPGSRPTSSRRGRDPPSKKSPGVDKEKIGEDVIPLSTIKAEQEQERLRRKEMFLQREKYKQQMIEKRQREEALKMERERRRLREMREELERQQIETEKLRLEAEKLRMERDQERFRREQQRAVQNRRPLKRRGLRGEEEWQTKRPIAERFQGGDRFGERAGHRGEEHRTFREDRPQRGEGRAARDERHPRNSARGPPRQDSRDWKSERGGSGGWNNATDHSKMEEEWDTGEMEQGDGWGNGVVLSQQSGFALQQGQMMSSGMGAGTVFIAQPAMQGPPVVMARQNDNRYGMGAGSVRRF